MSSPATRIGPYHVLRTLGAGGMGEIHLGFDERLGRHVAIKVLPAGLAREPDRLARFRNEAVALAAINHPNIAAIYGIEALEDGAPCLVLERVEGETLGARLARLVATLGEHVWRRLLDEGARLSVVDAVNVAIEWLERDTLVAEV